ncbi:hypothetical protein [Nostoc sp.]|uniref:hypothetical protein n=1 Tax=Nostoc sp. TaxID=1180 RepID=UPI002FF3F492
MKMQTFQNGAFVSEKDIDPIVQNQGDNLTEIDANGAPCQWFWNNGSVWLSRKLYQQNIQAMSGQGIVIGGVIGLISTTTDNIPFYQGNDYDFYITKIHAVFRVSSGSLSGSNYWSLQFRDTSSAVATLNITAGNGGETTGNIAKSMTVNTKYPKLAQGFYSIAFVKNGLAPNIVVPTALIEYRLART